MNEHNAQAKENKLIALLKVTQEAILNCLHDMRKIKKKRKISDMNWQKETKNGEKPLAKFWLKKIKKHRFCAIYLLETNNFVK